MKKLLVLTLSLLIVFAAIPMVMASAEDYSKVWFTMDEDSRPSSVGVTQRTDYTSYVDSGEEGYGNVLKVLRTGAKGTTQDQSLAIKLPSDAWTAYGNPVSITFDAKTDSGDIYFGSYVFLNDIITNSTINGYTTEISSFSSTWKTYTFNMTTDKAKTAVKDGYLYLCLRNSYSSSNTCNYYYIDNITINFTSFVGTFTGGADGDQLVYADETGLLTTPSATLTEGEFAGWITEENPDTVIPAGEELTLTSDTAYMAVSKVRVNQNAPAAPVVESKTSSTVTLVANSAYQYSIDGVTWQNSNVFSGLSSATKYTFYQRLKATPTKYASPASEGTTIETSTVYKWNLYSTYFTKNDGATLAGGFNTQYKNEGTYFVSLSNTVGATATLTSINTVKPGVYSAKLYARTSGARAKIDVYINGVKVKSALNTFTNTGLDVAFELDENTITVEEASTIQLTITTATTGNLYLNSLELIKIGDYVAPEEDGLTTDAIATQDSASIRINEVSGMRFYTTVDTTALADLGEVTERGTLIGPADKVGTYLTIEDTEIPEGATVENAVAVKYDLDKDLWENDEMVGSLVGIQEKNYTRDFVARAYVVVDGVYYYSKTTATKNVADIADAYLATNPKLDEVTSALVNSWAAAND